VGRPTLTDNEKCRITIAMASFGCCAIAAYKLVCRIFDLMLCGQINYHSCKVMCENESVSFFSMVVFAFYVLT